jgi:predicted nucleic acid-binding protein
MKTAYWDANVFHALFSEEPGRVEVCNKIIDAASRGELQIYTSTITFVECVWIKNVDRLSPQHEATIQKFFEHKFLRPIICDRAIAGEARKLLWTYPRLKPKDAIHVASALSQPIDVMHSYDDDDLVPLSGQLGNPPLTICHPIWADPPPPAPPEPSLGI